MIYTFLDPIDFPPFSLLFVLHENFRHRSSWLRILSPSLSFFFSLFSSLSFLFSCIVLSTSPPSFLSPSPPLHMPALPSHEPADNFRFSAQWLDTATAQPAPRTRISTFDIRENREHMRPHRNPEGEFGLRT